MSLSGPIQVYKGKQQVIVISLELILGPPSDDSFQIYFECWPSFLDKSNKFKLFFYELLANGLNFLNYSLEATSHGHVNPLLHNNAFWHLWNIMYLKKLWNFP